VKNRKEILVLLNKYISRYFFSALSFFIYFLICSCSNHQHISDLKLSLTDSVSFHLDINNTTQSGAVFYHEENGRSYFVYQDNSRNYIRVFDIESHEKVLDIPLPDSVHVLGFFMKKIDSIYLTVDGYKILLIDKGGNLKKTIDYYYLFKSYPYLGIVTSQSRFSAEAVFIRNYIYFIYSSDQKNYVKNSSPSDYRFCVRYNTFNDSVTLMKIALPRDFLQDGLKQYDLSMAFNGKRFIYAPLYSHDIFLSRDNNSIFKRITAKSKYVNHLNNYYPFDSTEDIKEYIQRIYDEVYEHSKISNRIVPEPLFDEVKTPPKNLHPLGRKAPTWEEAAYLFCTSHQYIGILWDKYRHVYYRFFWSGIDSVEAENKERLVKIFPSNLPNYGIMVLDEKFRVIDEIVLPKNIYTWDKYFVAKEGLYLSADYPDNFPNRKIWTFHIYKLIHKTKIFINTTNSDLNQNKQLLTRTQPAKRGQ
jgi:hypothetical protein